MTGEVAGSIIFETKIDGSELEQMTEFLGKKTESLGKTFSGVKEKIKEAFDPKSQKRYREEEEKTRKETDKLSEAFKKIRNVIGVAFSVTAIKEGLSTMIEAAAELQALDAQFDQVFQGNENAAALEAVNRQSEELGIHVDRLTATFSQFGAQVKGAGMEAAMAMEATEKATMLAADAAAFYDVSLEDAAASLASLMKGNFSAGDAIGVFTNATQMSIRANEMYGRSWEKLSEAERQWLLLDTVSKTYEMNGASGQAAREQDNWSNATENLKAAWKRFLEVVGSPVLSVAVNIIQAITDNLVDLVQFMQENQEAVETFGIIVIGVLTAIGSFMLLNNLTTIVIKFTDAISAAREMASALGAAMTSPIGQFSILLGVIIVIVPLITKLIEVWDQMSDTQKIVSALGLLATAAGVAAISVGALQSAWSMGVAAAAIVAGIAAITVSIKAAEARAKSSMASMSAGMPTGASNRSTSYQIPKLAKGAVIPPNREFLAILGDQTTGTNVEAPLSTIEQALENVMARRGSYGSGVAVLEIDGREFARILVPYMNGESVRSGMQLIEGRV